MISSIGRNGAKPCANPVRFVSLEAVQAQLVLFCKDGDRLFPHFIRCPHDADGNLTTVGDQDFFEVGHGASL